MPPSFYCLGACLMLYMCFLLSKPAFLSYHHLTVVPVFFLLSSLVGLTLHSLLCLSPLSPSLMVWQMSEIPPSCRLANSLLWFSGCH